MNLTEHFTLEELTIIESFLMNLILMKEQILSAWLNFWNKSKSLLAASRLWLIARFAAKK